MPVGLVVRFDVYGLFDCNQWFVTRTALVVRGSLACFIDAARGYLVAFMVVDVLSSCCVVGSSLVRGRRLNRTNVVQQHVLWAIL